MVDKIVVLAIDDDNMSQKFIHRALNTTFETLSAFNGEQGLAFAIRDKPSIILLDVEMPGLNGYEVCEKLKENAETRHIPVVFLSGRSSIEERLQGFDVGADDFLTKPFETEELIAKINVLLRFSEQQQALQQEIKSARSTANMAMTGTSDLGQIIQLIEQSYALKTVEELAECTLKYTSSLGLRCSLLVKNREDYQHFTPNGSISPLELELLKKLRNNNRFNDFSCRTQINFPNISILIKNMPTHDREKYGRIKDLMPAILGPLDAKIRSQSIEDAVKSHAIDLNASINSVKDSIQELNQSLQNNSKNSRAILSKMLNDLTLQLPGMGLETDQEEYVLDQVETAIVQSHKISDTDENLSASFTMLVSQLEKLLQDQNDLLSQSQNIYDNKNQQDLAIVANNVELF